VKNLKVRSRVRFSKGLILDKTFFCLREKHKNFQFQLQDEIEKCPWTSEKFSRRKVPRIGAELRVSPRLLITFFPS
jgi:hypothetical protein